MTFPAPPLLTADGIVYDVASRCLAVVVDAFAAALVELPERQYVAPGLIVAYDCEQVTVAVQQVGTGIPGTRANRPIANCPPTKMGTFRVEIVRCTPVLDENGEPPSVADLVANAKLLLKDLDVLESAFRAHPPVLTGPGEPIFVSAAQPVTAEGGMAASLVDVDIPLSWFRTS